MLNQRKLIHDSDKYQLRYMDELLKLEKSIGEVRGIISLVYNKKDVSNKESGIEDTNTQTEDDKIVWEQFPEKEEPSQVTHRTGAEGDDLEAAEEQPPAEEEGGEKKVPKFEIEDYRWTCSDVMTKNLPQTFLCMKGSKGCCDPNKTSAQFSTTPMEAIALSIDDFCQ